MNNLWKRFLSNKFLVSFSMLASGSIIAQLISILISPITTRLFTPEQFGLYTIIVTAVSIFGPIICLKYDMAIVVTKTEKDTYAVIKLCLLIGIPLSILIGVFYGMVFIRGSFTGLQLWGYILVVIILLAMYGVNNVLLAHNNKNALYKLISSVTVIKSVFNNILLVITGLLSTGIYGLLGSQIISSFAGLGRQSKDIRKNIGKLKDTGLSEVKKVFLEYRKQPIYNASSTLVTTLVYSSINLFIKIVYSVEQLGLYSLSYRVLGIPFAVISANIARVFFDSAVKEVAKDGNYKRTFKKTTLILSITIIPVIMMMAILSPWIFTFIFGTEWTVAGVYVRLLSPMFAVRLISQSLTTSFIISGKQHIELMFQGLLLVGQFLIYLVSFIKSIPVEQFLLIISLLYLIIYGSMMIAMYKLSKITVNDIKY